MHLTLTRSAKACFDQNVFGCVYLQPVILFDYFLSKFPVKFLFNQHALLRSHALTPCRFHSSAKVVKLSKSGVTPAKGSLTSGKLSPPRIDTPAEPQPEVDLVFLMDIIHAYTSIDIYIYICIYPSSFAIFCFMKLMTFINC